MCFFIFITGDSDSAAFGARANTLLDMTSEERDVYFVSGTNADWQRQTSLANSTTLILMVEVADLSQSSLLVEMLSRVLQSV